MQKKPNLEQKGCLIVLCRNDNNYWYSHSTSFYIGLGLAPPEEGDWFNIHIVGVFVLQSVLCIQAEDVTNKKLASSNDQMASLLQVETPVLWN